MLKTVRGAYDDLGLKVLVYEEGETYPQEGYPTSESLEENLIRGGLAKRIVVLDIESPEDRQTKVEAPEQTKPEAPTNVKEEATVGRKSRKKKTE